MAPLEVGLAANTRYVTFLCWGKTKHHITTFSAQRTRQAEARKLWRGKETDNIYLRGKNSGDYGIGLMELGREDIRGIVGV